MASLRESKVEGFNSIAPSTLGGDAIWSYTFMWAAKNYLKNEEWKSCLPQGLDQTYLTRIKTICETKLH